jgi:hypothetical protein
MLFTFWTGTLEEPRSIAAWRERFPKFCVFKDADVLALLESDEFREIFSQISIPACKSDIARLALLKEHGGLYVDSHIGPSEGDRLAETLEALARFDMILFSLGWHLGFNFMNGVVATRRQAPVLDLLMARAFSNLRHHRKLERQAPGHVPYDIFFLTGTYVMVDCIFDQSTRPPSIKPEFREKVLFHVMQNESSPGFHIYQFYDYRRPGDHWSERQQQERLFEQAGCSWPTASPAIESDQPRSTVGARSGYEGFVDGISDGHLHGWCHVTDSTSPVNLDVLVDERIVLSVAAARFRQDLLDAGIGQGAHGFSVPLGALQARPDSVIRVRVAHEAIELTNSGRTLRQYY